MAVSPAASLRKSTQSLTVADFNLDGTADLATPAGVLLGNGDGTFRSLPRAFSSDPIAVIATADFNEDGVPDLMIGASSTIAILFGKGDGSFQDPVTLPVAFTSGLSSVYLILGDLDGDGHVDILDSVTGRGKPPFGLLFRGAGDGTFSTPVSVPLPEGADNLHLADFNGDGIPDIVCSVTTPPSSATISVLLGQGSGVFAAPVAYSVPYFAPAFFSLNTTDLNNDGLADVVFFGPYANIVTVLLGRGDGTFSSAVDYTVYGSNETANILFTDFDGDGISDIAVFPPSGSLSVLLGKGDGTFSPAVTFPSFQQVGTIAVVAGEFNGDGRADLALVDRSGTVYAVTSASSPVQPSLSFSPESVNLTGYLYGVPVSQTVNFTFTSPIGADHGFSAALSPGTGSDTVKLRTLNFALKSSSAGTYTYAGSLEIGFTPPNADLGVSYRGSVVITIGSFTGTLPLTASVSAARAQNRCASECGGWRAGFFECRRAGKLCRHLRIAGVPLGRSDSSHSSSVPSE